MGFFGLWGPISFVSFKWVLFAAKLSSGFCWMDMSSKLWAFGFNMASVVLVWIVNF